MSQELYHSSESTLTLVRVKRWRSIISNRYPCLTLCRRTIEIQPEVWRPSVHWESWRAICSTPPQLLAALLQAPSLGESRFEGRLASSSERNQCAGCTRTPSSWTKKWYNIRSSNSNQKSKTLCTCKDRTACWRGQRCAWWTCQGRRGAGCDLHQGFPRSQLQASTEPVNHLDVKMRSLWWRSDHFKKTYMAKLSPRNWVAHYTLKLLLQIWGGQLFWMSNVEYWREETPVRSSPSLLGSSTDRSIFLVSSCNRSASILRNLQLAPSHTFAIDDSEIMCILLILAMKWSGISSQIEVPWKRHFTNLFECHARLKCSN